MPDRRGEACAQPQRAGPLHPVERRVGIHEAGGPRREPPDHPRIARCLDLTGEADVAGDLLAEDQFRDAASALDHADDRARGLVGQWDAEAIRRGEARTVRGGRPPREECGKSPCAGGLRQSAPASAHVVRDLQHVAAPRETSQRVEAPIERPAEGGAPVEMKHVEREVHRRKIGGRRRTRRQALAEPREVRPALRVEDRDDAVEHGAPAVRGRYRAGHVREPSREVGEHLPLDADSRAWIEEEQRARAVPVDAEQPVGIVERLGARHRGLERDVPGEQRRCRRSKQQRLDGRRRGGTRQA